jgi:two-component system, sensor histidine kinase YesM
MAIRGFWQRLLLSNLVLLTVLFVVAGVSVGLLLDHYLRAEFTSQQYYRVGKMGQQLDTVLDQMNRLSLSILASRQLQETFAKIPRGPGADYFVTHPAVRTDVRDALLSFTSLQPLKGRICLISRNQDLVDLSNSQDTIRFTKTELAALSRDRASRMGDEAKVLLGPHIEPWSRHGREVIALARKFQDSDQQFGWMEINQELESLNWIWSSLRDDKASSIALYSEEGKLLFSNFTSAPPTDRGLVDGSETAVGKLAFSEPLERAPWKLAIFADKRDFQGPLSNTLAVLSLFGLMGFLLTALVSWTSLRSVTRPVLALTAQVRKIHGLGQDLEKPDSRAPEEVLVLGEAFQDLIGSLRSEHQALLHSQNQGLSARMAALQAQLNPHFIFNTLMSISAYGKKADGQAVHQMCNSLSSILRYSLESAAKPATLGQELEQAEEYCMLMSRRFRPYFDYSIEGSAGIESVAVPRLLLQPVLENAFVHGFSDRPGPWSLRIRAGADRGQWEVSVQDNGGGMMAERIEAVMNELKSVLAQDNSEMFDRDFSRGKLGLVSTIVRLRLLYRDASSFSVETPPEGGCLIRLGGPLVAP